MTDKIVLNKVNDSFVTLTFDKVKKGFDDTIFVSSKEELEMYLYLLGQNCTVESSTLPSEIKSWLSEKTYNKIQEEAKITILKKKELLKALENINLFDKADFLSKKLLKKESLHKTSDEDVMISALQTLPSSRINIFVGNTNHTKEIKLDHINQEHVEAIILTEICRQSAIATVVEQLGPDAQFYIVEEFKKYEYLVVRDVEVFIQTVLLGKRNGMGLCAFTLFQMGKQCMSGYFFGYNINKAKQQSSKAAKQQSSKAAKQQSSKAAKQQSSKASYRGNHYEKY